MEKIKVLITSIGSNTSIGIAKCLKNHCYIVGTDINNYFECNGYIFTDKFFKINPANSLKYEEELIEIIKKEKIDCVIPINDIEIEVIASFKHKYNFVKWALNELEIIKLCNNKYDINNFLSNICNVPKQYLNTSDIQLPIIIKPKNGVSSNGIKVIYEIDDLQLKAIDKNTFMQNFIEGTEYTVDCYSSFINDDFFASVRIRKETKSGMSVKSEIIKDDYLAHICKNIHEKLKYKGASNIQFIKKDNTYFFIEINPRFAGAGILTYQSGYNYPLFTIEELIYGQAVDCNEKKLSFGNKMVRYYCETIFDNENNII
ncbi:ATP-grasp domain-containing protein [Cloacibacterium sp.]|uniref:ATP-grasp domain-containing protein n=1 Tax=Cloacibacterium sp. TaxID=1913682 RepID=UPI0035B20CBB